MKVIYILLFLTTIPLKSYWTIYDPVSSDTSGKLLGISSSVIYLDNKDNIWAKISNYGLMVFKDNSFIIYDTSNTPLSFMQISCITQGPNGDMYFGTFEDTTFEPKEKQTCLIRFDGDNWELYNQHNSPMHPYTIWDILVTGEDEFWVATMIGLFHYKEGTWNSFFEDENDFRRNIRRPAKDKNNNLYITNTLNEVYTANLNNSNIKFNKIETLSKGINVSTSCFVDSLNNLWLENRKELHKRKNVNDWIVYDSTHLDNDVHRFSFYISRTGKIFTNNNKAVYEYKENTYWEKIFDVPDSIVEISLRGLDSKGSFWFAGGNRLYKYTPEGASVAQKSNVTLYPNPSQSSITVTAEQSITSLALYSLNLSKIKDLNPNHTTTQEINISTLPAGIYFIMVNDEFVKFVRE